MNFREPQPRHAVHGRRLRSNPLRRFQTQLVPGSADPHKYIPLRVKPTSKPKLWWQPMTINIPSTYSTVTIVNQEKPEETTTTSTTTVEEPTTTISPFDGDFTTEDYENEDLETTTVED